MRESFVRHVSSQGVAAICHILAVNANNIDKPTQAHFHQVTHKIVKCKRNWFLATEVRNTESVVSLPPTPPPPLASFSANTYLCGMPSQRLITKKDNLIYISLKYTRGLMEKYVSSYNLHVCTVHQ